MVLIESITLLNKADEVFMHHCCINDNDCKHQSQHWYLNNYFGISGYFCGYHYCMVSHDAYGLPINKEEYEKMLSMQEEYLSKPNKARGV